MTQEVKVEKIYWIPLVILTVVFSVAGTLATALNGAVGMNMQCSFNWGVYSRPVYVASLSLLFPMFLYPLRKRLNTTTLVSLYTAGLVVSYALGHYESFALIPTGFTSLLLYTSEPTKSLMQSWWWVPPYDVVRPLNTGGVNLFAPISNWGPWIPTIFFWSAYYFVFFFFSSTLMLIFRRRWIDIEKVPFPHVVAAYETIKRVGPSEEPKGRGRWFLMGMVVGLLFAFQLVFTYLFPWWPDILLWRASGQAPTGCYHPPTGDILSSSIVGWVGYSKDPLSFAMFYLAPLDISFSVWVMYLITVILSQIAYAFGYYTGFATLNGGCCRIFGSGTSFGLGPPFYWGYVGTLGGVIGIVVMMLWNSRHYLAETFRTARQGKNPEIEQREPFSYRTIYVLLAASIIAVLLFELSAGLSLATALVVLVFGGFFNVLSQTYVLGLTGMSFINDRDVWRGFPLGIIWPTAPSGYTTDYLMSHSFMTTSGNHPSHGPLVTGMIAGQAYRMADISGVTMKHIYYLTVLCAIIAYPTVIATRIWVLNLLGSTRVPIWTGCSIENMCGNSISWVYSGGRATMDVQFESLAGGAVITIALFVLRNRFIWWPINPVGFVVATSISTIWFGSWDAFFGAWVAKYLTLRIGGSKAYEQYGLPLAGGLVAGITLGSFLAYIVGMTRFFISF